MRKKKESVVPNININKALFLLVISLAFLAIFYVGDTGKKQNAVWYDDYKVYAAVQRLYPEGRFAEACNLYDTLLAKPAYQNSTAINLDMAAMTRQMQEYDRALEYFAKARKAYPAIVNELFYLQEYAMAMYETNNDAEAVRYLQRIIDIAKEDADRQQAQQLIETIRSKAK